MRIEMGGVPLPKTRSRKVLWLVALLVLKKGEPVSRTWIASTLWPDADTEAGLGSLRSVISDLRRALGGEADRLIARDRKSFGLDLSGVEADVLRFDEATRVCDFEKAVGLYAGSLLEDCDEDWAVQERKLREQACLGAYRELGETATTAGNLAKAIAYAERAVGVAPWRDQPRRDLMISLAQNGDLNGALDAYREFAKFLRREVGSTPDLQTTDLYVRLRSGEAGVVAPPAQASSPTLLPQPISSFVGRDDELTELTTVLRQNRLVTLTGMGGIGKTRLALQISNSLSGDYADGVFLVALESVHKEEGILRQMANVLGLNEELGRSVLESVLTDLRPKQQLMILDNCEHLIGACGKLCQVLLEECRGLRILATSREPLGISGEKIWSVPGLSVPDPQHLPEQTSTLLRVLMSFESVQLFVERVQASNSAFKLSHQNAHSVAELCAMIEGAPLGIELAACQVRTMGVEEIVRHLGQHRLDFLTGGRHTAASRHHTLRATLDWSYSLLTSEERELLCRLSVFAGSWSLEAMEGIVGGSPALFGSLVDKSLVTFGANGRYALLETVKQYAGEKLSAEARALVEADFGSWYADYVEGLSLTRPEVAPLAFFAQVELDLPNFRAAIESSECGESARLRLVNALRTYWHRRFAISEGIHYAKLALDRDEDRQPMALRAEALFNYAAMIRESDKALAAQASDESLQLFRQLEDRTGMVKVLRDIALYKYFDGNFAEAKEVYEEALENARASNDQRSIGIGAAGLSLVVAPLGNYRRAFELSEEGISIFRELNDTYRLSWLLRTTGLLHFDTSDFQSVKRCNEEALEIFRSCDSREGIAWCLVDLGRANTESGQPKIGEELIQESLQIFRDINEQLPTASAQEALARNSVVQGSSDEAVRLLNESLSVYRSSKHNLGVARVLDSLGDLQADPAISEGLYKESLTIWKGVGDLKSIRLSLHRLGVNAFATGDLSRSARLGAHSVQLGERIELSLPPSFEALSGYLTNVKTSHPADWEAGRHLETGDAIDLALEH
jgi:predicted ATPase/DNA-binding SARP family transcriptional activator